MLFLPCCCCCSLSSISQWETAVFVWRITPGWGTPCSPVGFSFSWVGWSRAALFNMLLPSHPLTALHPGTCYLGDSDPPLFPLLLGTSLFAFSPSHLPLSLPPLFIITVSLTHWQQRGQQPVSLSLPLALPPPFLPPSFYPICLESLRQFRSETQQQQQHQTKGRLQVERRMGVRLQPDFGPG